MNEDKDDKYADEEEGMTQVRSIIKQLNEDKPSKEKSREVVIRADGTKVVRVVKKRRIMVSEKDKRRKGRRQFLAGLLVSFCVIAVLVGLFIYRMATMAGSAYLEQQAAALKESWGATEVRFSGVGVSGNTLRLDSVNISFPEDSMVQSVDMSGISAELDSATFISGVLSGELVKVQNVHIQLKEGTDHLNLPQAKGDDVWNFRRVECETFSLQVGSVATTPVLVDKATAYMYYPSKGDRSNCVVSLHGGTFKMKGWRPINIGEAKFNLTKDAVADFAIMGTTDSRNISAELSPTNLSIFGHVARGGSLAGPFTFDSHNVPLSEFTDSRFTAFLSAKSEAVQRAKDKSQARILMPFGTDRPHFTGEFSVQNLTVVEFPALAKMLEHLEPHKRREYLPATIEHARVVLGAEGDTISVKIEEGQAAQRDVIDIKGEMVVDRDNILSGAMSYGIPGYKTHAEYPDGKADPIFTETDGTAWVNTQLSGTASRPMDDSEVLEARAAELRKSRPARMQFAAIDLDKMAREANLDSGVQKTAADSGEALPSSNLSIPGTNQGGKSLKDIDRDNPFGDSSQDTQQSGGLGDPFTPVSPF